MINCIKNSLDGQCIYKNGSPLGGDPTVSEANFIINPGFFLYALPVSYNGAGTSDDSVRFEFRVTTWDSLLSGGTLFFCLHGTSRPRTP